MARTKKGPKTALVTGGAGFIGSHLCEELLIRHFKVIALDNLASSNLQNLEIARRNKKQFKYVKGSILDARLVRALTGRVDIVFHLAAAVGVKYIIDHPIKSIRTNVEGTENVLDAASRYGKKVVVTSSSEIYGDPGAHKIKESDKRILGSTLVPRWSYAASKGLDEFLAHAYQRERKLKVIIIRFFNTIGPRQLGSFGMVMPRFIKSALTGKPLVVFGDGKQKRVFNYVYDAVRAVADLSLVAHAYGDAFNIGGNQEPIEIGQLAKQIKVRLKSKSKIIYQPYESYYGKDFEDVRCRIPDIAKLQRTVNFKPHFTLEDMIDVTSDYIQKHLGMPRL